MFLSVVIFFVVSSAYPHCVHTLIFRYKGKYKIQVKSNVWPLKWYTDVIMQGLLRLMAYSLLVSTVWRLMALLRGDQLPGFANCSSLIHSLSFQIVLEMFCYCYNCWEIVNLLAELPCLCLLWKSGWEFKIICFRNCFQSTSITSTTATSLQTMSWEVTTEKFPYHQQRSMGDICNVQVLYQNPTLADDDCTKMFARVLIPQSLGTCSLVH